MPSSKVRLGAVTPCLFTLDIPSPTAHPSSPPAQPPAHPLTPTLLTTCSPPHPPPLGTLLDLPHLTFLSLRYDGTVRNSAGEVVQFLYGEDGMDGVRVENQRLPHLKATPAQLRARFGYDRVMQGVGSEPWLTPEQTEALRGDLKARWVGWGRVGVGVVGGGGSGGQVGGGMGVVVGLGVAVTVGTRAARRPGVCVWGGGVGARVGQFTSKRPLSLHTAVGGCDSAPCSPCLPTHDLHCPHHPHDSPNTHPPLTPHSPRTHSPLREEVTGEFARLMEDLRIMRTEVMVGGDDTIRLPIAWERLIRNAQMKFDCGPWRPPKPDPGFGPLDIIKRVKVRLGWGGGEEGGVGG